MEHSISTLNTKKALAASLKEILKEKPFSKVTVSEIIDSCKVNRKTFYYHFEDIYALLKWTLEQEAIDVVKNFDLIAEYDEAVTFVMDYIEENNDFLKNIYYSVGREELKRFFYFDFTGIVCSIVDEAENKLKLTVSKEYKDFVVNFFTEALVGILVDWIVSHENKDREKTMKYIFTVMRSSVVASLKNENAYEWE